jgi:predicted phosphodiesterase
MAKRESGRGSGGLINKANEEATKEKQSDLKRKLGIARNELAEERARNKKLVQQIDQVEDRIDKLRKTGFRIPVGRRTRRKKGSFIRVVIPDTHGCLADQDALAALFGDMEVLNASEVVLLGDHLECGGFLAQHHTLGYVAQTEYTFDEDVFATNQFLDKVQELAPKAAIDYIEGNHERRIENWCVTQAVKNNVDAEFLRKRTSVDAVLSLEKRKINWIRQGKFYDDLPVPATIKRGNCHFTHGSSTSKNAAATHVKMFNGNVVYGHTHRSDSYVIRTVTTGVIGGWSPGCLCILQPLWQHTNPTDWSHGYGLQLANEDGSFLHINVPIIKGKSYLEPLFKAVV